MVSHIKGLDDALVTVLRDSNIKNCLASFKQTGQTNSIDSWRWKERYKNKN